MLAMARTPSIRDPRRQRAAEDLSRLASEADAAVALVNDAILAAIRVGVPVRELAQITGVSRGQVSRRFPTNGPVRPFSWRH